MRTSHINCGSHHHHHVVIDSPVIYLITKPDLFYSL